MKIKRINVKYKCKVGKGQESKYVGNVGFNSLIRLQWETESCIKL